jgi:hypothetical protein
MIVDDSEHSDEVSPERPRMLTDSWPGGRWTLIIIALLIILAAALAARTLHDEPTDSTSVPSVSAAIVLV